MKQLKECLVLLLYCAMTVNPGVVANVDFAFHHAINLAEAGQTIQDKRIGYLFCAELMPPEHELQLMLVNTLRKDLESHLVPRICLALDTLIHFSTEDFIPAIQSRLIDLLSHSSSVAYSEPIVASAALIVCVDSVKTGHISDDMFHSMLSKLYSSTWSSRPDPGKNNILLKVMNALRFFTPSERDLALTIEILRAARPRGFSARAAIYQCFLVAANAPLESLLATQAQAGTSFVQEIQHLLTSEDVNDVYLFVVCLSHIDPALWAGTSSDIPAVLEEWEVERVMRLLESADKCIRTKTLCILQRVDRGIVEAYYTQLLRGDSQTRIMQDPEEHSRRLLEIIQVICGEDGELYIQHIKSLLPVLEGSTPLNKRRVLQEAVEDVLVHVRSANANFQSSCIGVLFANITEPDLEIGPTLMVILTALISEYLYMSPISPVNLLRGLSKRLSLYSGSIQDACLLSMTRIAAESDEAPSDVVENVSTVRDRSSRYVRRRCDQFISLSRSKAQIKHIISMAKSTALPDFMVALETYEVEKDNREAHLPSSPSLVSARSSESVSRNSPYPHELRYDAYEPPKLTSRLRRLSNSSSSRQSEDGSSRFIGQVRASQEALARTITPGDLALVAGQAELTSMASPPAPNTVLPVVQIMDEDDTTSRVDLIALDSPFVSEPLVSISTASSVSEFDFEATWNLLDSANSRGWSEVPINVVVGRLQGLQRRLKMIAADVAPFEGDVKIIISPEIADTSSTRGVAVLRLKGSEDGSCLWRLRCGDEQLRSSIRNILSG
ncbi:hypothetical protein SCP_0404770 [Sparassis crispa]|uniref:Clathrin/coatomer adaptor adaptin-like N-terminal domain-containing protein n=1 Tax=Sparassis crispa TaxID=139825 RepID=A0A401GIW6_9APHY|nr:hypothetical protein SCP_0404770 [Sparassis crispa]GBE82098.1 hypothetical protein SCP_0404770 [Sparassis crispa]